MINRLQVLCCLSCMLMWGGAPAGGLDGQFQGDINGTPSTLILQTRGSQLQGEIDAGGYRYVLQGETDGTRAQGQLNDPQTGGAMVFHLTPDASGLVLTLLPTDYSTGQTQEIPIHFRPIGTGAAAGAPTGNAQPDTPTQSAQASAGQLDPRLIGRWSASDTMISGAASFVSASSVTFAADGTYLYQDGPAYASGSFDSGSTSIASSGAGGGDAGRWRVQGDLLYTMPNATGQWQLLGRVYIEGARALVYYPDGSKTVWQRSQ